MVDSISQFNILQLRMYFLKNTLTDPSYVEVEFAGRLYVHFLAQSFQTNGMKHKLIMSWGTFEKLHHWSYLLKFTWKYISTTIYEEFRAHDNVLVAKYKLNITSKFYYSKTRMIGRLGNRKFDLNSFAMGKEGGAWVSPLSAIASRLNVRDSSTLMGRCENSTWTILSQLGDPRWSTHSPFILAFLKFF